MEASLDLDGLAEKRARLDSIYRAVANNRNSEADHAREAALLGIAIHDSLIDLARLGEQAGSVLVEWLEAHRAYNAEVAKGPVVPPDEPNFEPWDRMRAADSALQALAAKLRKADR